MIDLWTILLIAFLAGIVSSFLMLIYMQDNIKEIKILLIIATAIAISGFSLIGVCRVFGKETQTVFSQDEIESISIRKHGTEITTNNGECFTVSIVGETLNKDSDISVIVTRDTLGCFYFETAKVVVK